MSYTYTVGRLTMTSAKLSDKVYLTCVMNRQFCDDSVVHYISSEIPCIRKIAGLNSCSFL